MVLGDALLLRGDLEPLVEIGLALRVDDARQLGRVGDFRVEVLIRDRDIRLGQRLLQQQVRNLDVEHLFAVPQQALFGQLLVGNRLAVDRGHDARHLGAKLRIVPDVLNGRRLLKLLEQSCRPLRGAFLP